MRLLRLLSKVLENILSFLSFSISTINYSDIKKFISKIRVKDVNYELIRIGEMNDGGYLLPEKIITKNKYLLSAGVGDTTKFEDDLKKKFKIESFLIDFSVNLSLSKYNFTKKKIDYFDNYKNKITLNSWIDQIKNSHNINLTESILKIDIESYEIEAFLNISENNLSKFTILIVEFHDFASLKNKISLRIYNIIFDKILKYFEICHIHPSNCSGSFKIRDLNVPYVMEFTFINKRFCDNISFLNKKNYPLKNDAKTLKFKRDIILPESLIYRN